MTTNFTNAKNFGAIGDGVTDDTISLRLAFTSTIKTGKTLYIPSGTYIISDTIIVGINEKSKDIGIFCDPGTVIKANSDFTTDKQMIYFLAKGGDVSFKWEGGTIDGRLMPKKVKVGSPDGLSINGGNGYINKVDISNLKIILNNDRSTSAGDSCMFISADDIHITNCIFQGAVDAGIYLSGNAETSHGRRCYVSGNTFLDCFGVGFISKREYEYHIIDGNFFENCGVGCAVGGAAGPGGSVGSLKGGRKTIITNNMLKKVNRGLELRMSDDSMITGNRIEDYGITYDGKLTPESAILISGSNRCIVSNNITTFSGDYIPNTGSSAVRINKRVEAAIGTFLSSYNLITNNIFSTNSKIKNSVEESKDCNFNMIQNNLAVGFV